MRNIKSEILSDIVNQKKSEASYELSQSQIFNYAHNITRERFDIENEIQAKFYNKSIGRYELISIPNPIELSSEIKKKIANIFSEIVSDLMGKTNEKSKILIVGLGNRHISADSLGTKVISKINVTISHSFPKIMAICPSVLGLTGIETYDIISGVISKVKPTHLILIDSLCAGSEERLGKSIQISNTGICPGSGIGNKRKCLDKNLARNVISIGVPLLIYSSTFVTNIMDKFDINLERLNSIMQSIKKSGNLDKIYNLCKDIKECITMDSDSTIVTIKDIEECVDVLSEIISKGINIALGVDFE